jgi:hypothetical protein
VNKIEEVAREIAKVATGSEENWKDFCEEARAAIEAMRVPTEGMVDAAYAYDNSGAQLSESYDVIYTVMIDAALEGK